MPVADRNSAGVAQREHGDEQPRIRSGLGSSFPRWARQYMTQEYGRIRARLRSEGLIEWCRSFMRREHMLGVHVAAKTLALLPDEDRNLKLRLTAQILEEWKHSQISLNERRRSAAMVTSSTLLRRRGLGTVPLDVPLEPCGRIGHRPPVYRRGHRQRRYRRRYRTLRGYGGVSQGCAGPDYLLGHHRYRDFLVRQG